MKKALAASAIACMASGLVGQGAQGYALRLGPDTELEFPHHPIMQTGAAATMEFWCRDDGSGHQIRWERYSPSQEHKCLRVRDDGLVGYVYAGSPWGIGFTGTQPGAVSADAQWHHVAFVRRAIGSWSVYVDGQAVVQAGPGAGFNNGCWLTCNVIETSTVTSVKGASATKHSWDIDELRISSVERYSGASFVPQRYFVADASTAMHLTFDEGAGSVVNDSGPTQQQGSFVGGVTPTWTWVALQPPATATATPYGTGCGTPAMVFTPTSTAITGQNLTGTITNTPTPLCLVAFGASDTLVNGVPVLPFDLGAIGMPGCTLYQSTDIFGLGTTGNYGTGQATFTLGIPSNPALWGQHFYFQAISYAPGVNSLDSITSNGIDFLIGNQ